MIEYIKFIEEGGKTIKSVIRKDVIIVYQNIQIFDKLMIGGIVYNVKSKYYDLDKNEICYHVY